MRSFDVHRNDNRLPALVGREAIEHHFVLHRKWLPSLRPVVEIETQYFGRPERLPGTDHFSIAKPTSIDAPVHRSLVALHQSIEDRQKELENLTASVTLDQEVLRQPLPVLVAQVVPTVAEVAAKEFADLRESMGRRSLAEAFSVVLVVCGLVFLIGYRGPLLYQHYSSNSAAVRRQKLFEKALDIQTPIHTRPSSSRYKESTDTAPHPSSKLDLERATMIATEATWEPLSGDRGVLRAEIGKFQFRYVTGESKACVLNAPDSAKTGQQTTLAAVGVATVGMGIRAAYLLSKEKGVSSTKWLVGTGAGALVIGYLTNELQKSLETEEQRQKLATDATYWSTTERGMERVCRQITEFRLRARGLVPTVDPVDPHVYQAGYSQLATLDQEVNPSLASCIPPQSTWPDVRMPLCRYGPIYFVEENRGETVAPPCSA